MVVYITGHRNPDLDSVCSAYAYSVLKNTIDPENKYIAIRCGHLSDSCKNIVDSLGINVPPYKPDVFPRVSDVMLTAEDMPECSEPLTVIAKDYKDSNPSVVPISKEGCFEGLLSVDDISAWYMNGLSNGEDMSRIPTIEEVMREQETPVQASDLFEEAKLSLSTSKKRGLAVFKGDNYAGYITRRCFLKAPQYNVIMVDHNEPKQSIKGIENANILEIIDHHRLDALKTKLPIFIDAEPLGSTCTIVYRLFMRNGIVPDELTAKTLLTGMMSDTLVLKSPTTTQADRDAAGELAKLCNVQAEEFGRKMYSNMVRIANVDPQKAILSDFKRYSEKGTSIGIGQCEATTLNDIDEYKESFAKALEDVRIKNGLDWAVVMVTDVLSEHSVLFTTAHRAAKHLSYSALEEGIYDMPGVMSRKKQLLPEMISSLGM